MDVLNVKTCEDFERLVLGISHADVGNYCSKNKATFQESIEAVKKMQGQFNWNPKRPKTELSRDLFNNVCLFLNAEEAKRLRLFVSVGTELDFRYGTDFFFESKGSVATVDLTIIDLTISRWKHCKANVLIRLDDIEGGFRIRLAKRIARFIQKIA